MKRFGLILLALLAAAVVHAQTHTVVTYEGAWSSTPTYVKSAVVTESGATYVSVQAGNQNHDPAADSGHTWWALLPGFTGGTVANPITAPSFTASGPNAGSLTLVAGTVPSAPTNSVVLAAPSTVTTPYVLSPPAAPPGSTAQTLSCAGTTAALCNWVTAASGLGNGITTGVNGGNYTCLTWTGSCANGAAIGMLADKTGADPSNYQMAATGGGLRGKSGSSDVYQFAPGNEPTGSCSGTYFLFSAGDGHISWCNGSTWVQKI